jgi:hypothetical protein
VGAMAMLGTPSDFDSLCVTDCLIGLRRSKHTEVRNAADEHGLTLELLGLVIRQSLNHAHVHTLHSTAVCLVMEKSLHLHTFLAGIHRKVLPFTTSHGAHSQIPWEHSHFCSHFALPPLMLFQQRGSPLASLGNIFSQHPHLPVGPVVGMPPSPSH